MLICILAILCVGCEPPCLRGHYVTVHVEGWFSMEPITIGDMTIYINQYNPPYDYQKFVCDQYELEKMPK